MKQPFQEDVDSYKPTIEDLHDTGNKLDNLLRELQSPLQSAPHYRSTELGTGQAGQQMVSQDVRDSLQSGSFMSLSDDDSDIKRQLTDVDRRYDSLKIKIKDRQDDIDLARLFLDRLGFVNDRLDWCANAENKLMKKKPSSRELDPLKKEYDVFKVNLKLILANFTTDD